ncbi:MAG: hypothetical protein ABIR17_07115 [Pseudolysinimonas sp.]|uniref:hypothetical protein n=1 Tax=Pseudolysinimonas sp. TaxID=2680009 RepID=UPI003262FBF8
MSRRGVALFVAVAVLAASVLTACTPNRPNEAIDWLKGRHGVIGATVLADHSDAFASGGTIRGELDPAISETDLDKLVDEVQGYLNDHGEVSIRLGRNGVDFGVYIDDGDTGIGRDLWTRASGISGLVSGVASGATILMRVLRPDAATTLRALERVVVDVEDRYPVAIELEAFRSAEALAATASDDDFFGGLQDLNALGYQVAAGCSPTTVVQTFALDLAADNRVDGGTLDLCNGLDVQYAAGVDMAQVVTETRTRLESDELAAFPVTVAQAAGGFADAHHVEVTPGDAALLDIVPALAAQDPSVYYSLDAARNLVLTDWEHEAATLLPLLASAPSAPLLPSIRLEAKDMKATGTYEQLASLIQQATDLRALDPEFSDADLSSENVILELYSPVGTDPDMAAAVTALRSSPIWMTHTVDLSYLNFHVYIQDGVATIGDPDYVGGEVMTNFVTLWNAPPAP